MCLDRYYDHTSMDCLLCSKCCGDDWDVVEDECKKKLGATSNMICSFHSSINRCSTTTASVHDQGGTTAQTRPTYSSVTPSDTTDHLRRFITKDDLKSLHPPVKRKTSPQSGADSSPGIVVGPILGIVAILAFGYATYYFCKRRTHSCSTCNIDDIETGCHHSEAEAGVLDSHKGIMNMRIVPLVWV